MGHRLALPGGPAAPRLTTAPVDTPRTARTAGGAERAVAAAKAACPKPSLSRPLSDGTPKRRYGGVAFVQSFVRSTQNWSASFLCGFPNMVSGLRAQYLPPPLPRDPRGGHTASNTSPQPGAPRCAASPAGRRLSGPALPCFLNLTMVSARAGLHLASVAIAAYDASPAGMMARVRLSAACSSAGASEICCHQAGALTIPPPHTDSPRRPLSASPADGAGSGGIGHARGLVAILWGHFTVTGIPYVQTMPESGGGVEGQ